MTLRSMGSYLQTDTCVIQPNLPSKPISLAKITYVQDAGDVSFSAVCAYLARRGHMDFEEDGLV